MAQFPASRFLHSITASAHPLATWIVVFTSLVFEIAYELLNEMIYLFISWSVGVLCQQLAKPVMRAYNIMDQQTDGLVDQWMDGQSL